MSTSPAEKVDIGALGKCIVETPDGRKIQFSHLWKKQTTIFIFLRHFACIACRAHAMQVWQDREKYEGNGGRIIFVGNGQAHFIEKFQEDLGLKSAMMVTDPSRNVFKMAGFREGFFYVVNPVSAINAVKLALKGNRQTAYSADAGTHWQLGGILVISKYAKVLYHYISESLGDFPEEETLKNIQLSEVPVAQAHE